MSGRESVHGAVPVSAALAKPAVVAVPVHRVRTQTNETIPAYTLSPANYLLSSSDTAYNFGILVKCQRQRLQ